MVMPPRKKKIDRWYQARFYRQRHDDIVLVVGADAAQGHIDVPFGNEDVFLMSVLA